MLFQRTGLSISVVAAGLMLLLSDFAAGQIIVDRRPTIPIVGSYEIKQIGIDATLRDQVAQVQVSQTFRNPGGGALEAEYLFPLPDDGAVQNIVLLVDGKELPGKLLPRDEARRIYESIVRSKRDPALLEYAGLGLFKTSVFPIPAGAERTVTLRYTALCRRDRDTVEFFYPLGTDKHCEKPIGKLLINVRLNLRDPIKNLYSPSHDDGVKIHRAGENEATARLEQQGVAHPRDFRLFYTVAQGSVGATVLSYRPVANEDGYFLVLASPGFSKPDQKPLSKTVILVIDKSGSMAGKKIDQARKAARFVLENLNEGDLFNIITYDDRVESFKPELQRYVASVKPSAAAFIDNIREGGSTNIDGALNTAMAMLQDNTRPSYVLFLTDGLPTAGELNEMKIAENTKSANKIGARVIAFGVGFDVNARLLDRISHGNGGVSEYVKPDDNIEGAVGWFYGRITSPVFSKMRIELAGTQVNRAYPQSLPDLFEGSQLVWAGRYTQSGKTTVKITGKVGEADTTLEYPAELAATGSDPTYQFVEKLWAIRRVGDLIDQIDLHGRNSELIAELVELSKKHGILTPYTSFLAEEGVRLGADSQNAARAWREADQLEQLTTGEAGQGQRALKGGYLNSAQAAPQSSVGGKLYADTIEGDKREVETVRNIGGKTFYRKQGRWMDSSVSEEQDAKAKVVRQFSEEYFELSRRQGADANQYLTLREPATVKLNGDVYRIDPAQ